MSDASVLFFWFYFLVLLLLTAIWNIIFVHGIVLVDSHLGVSVYADFYSHLYFRLVFLWILMS